MYFNLAILICQRINTRITRSFGGKGLFVCFKSQLNLLIHQANTPVEKFAVQIPDQGKVKGGFFVVVVFFFSSARKGKCQVLLQLSPENQRSGQAVGLNKIHYSLFRRVFSQIGGKQPLTLWSFISIRWLDPLGRIFSFDISQENPAISQEFRFIHSFIHAH